jgi:electron transfer flavoprotein beta subunit
VLLSDTACEGSDAWGTAHVLAQAIRALGGFDLILMGRQSVDGNSGLVAPGLAAKLGLPFVSQVAKVVELSDDSITVLRALDGGVQTVRVPLPAVISVSKEINEPRYPNFLGVRKASRMQIPVTGAGEIPGLLLEQVGPASARVVWTNIRKPPPRANRCEFIAGANAAEQAASLVERLIADKVI